jgi:hypothetical protein
VEDVGEVAACAPVLRCAPAAPQPLINAAADIRTAMTMVLADLHPVGAGRVGNDPDFAVATRARLLQALNDEAR